LLQQWTNNRRSPIVVQQWLQQERIDEEEDENRSSPPSPSSRLGQQIHRRSFHNSTNPSDSLGLSSVDTSPSSPSIAPPATSWTSSRRSGENRIEKEFLRSGILSRTSASIRYGSRQKSEKSEKALYDIVLPENLTMNERDASNTVPSSMSKNVFGYVGGATNSSTSLKMGGKSDPRQHELDMAIHRAVKMSKIAHLRKDRRAKSSDGKPFTFRKLLSMSRSGRRLVDIQYEVTLRATGDQNLASEERKSWSEVPMFLIALVHNNQATIEATGEEEEDIYKALRYSPPTTEEQLEDYASACAAAQTAIHSLTGDGFDTEWVTSSVIKTPAFRSLVKAKPTDRIAALIKVHDMPTYKYLSH